MLVRQGQVKAVTKRQQRRLVEFFLAVRGHLALAGLAHAIAFFGVRQDDGGLAGVGCSSRVSRVDFHEVVAAAFEPVDLLVAQTLRELREFGVLAEESFTVETTILGRKSLHLAVHSVGECFDQGTVRVASEQAVPVAAPNQFDHVPTGTAKQFF